MLVLAGLLLTTTPLAAAYAGLAAIPGGVHSVELSGSAVTPSGTSSPGR